jgi:EAL domain-containing protein (putative c-di-GMP-specific phosphodiesterase class I)
MRETDSRHALRADWLKLRGCLHDPTTRLPVLAAVLDDVRRRVEGGEPIGLIYLDLSGEGEAEVTSGWQAHDRALAKVADLLRASRESWLDEQDALAVVGVRSDELLLFLGLGDGADEAAARQERLQSVHKTLVEAIRASLDELSAVDATFTPTLLSAGLELRTEPTVRIERSIYGSLGRARDICRKESLERQSGRLQELRRMLASGEIVIRYQPIVSLRSGLVHGFEALSSARSNEIFENPEMLFSFAEESDAIIDLERLCRSQALARLEPLRQAAGGKLFLNCSVHAFADPRLLDDLIVQAAAAGLRASDLVLEITERTAIKEWQRFQQTLGEIRRKGLQIAIDDMGSGYSSLRAVGEIQPDYLKFDCSLIHGIHLSPIKRDLFETLVTLARKIGAQAIAEGIEISEEFETVRALGVDLGQGYLFARPAPPSEPPRIHFPR